MGQLAALWGVSGMVLLLVYAITRLTEISIDSFNYEYHWHHWAVLVASVAFMAYSEGYKGFHKAFAPRFAARLRYLRDNPKWLHGLLAPLFGMGYFHAATARLIRSYALTVMIILFIYLAHQLPQPWRGILDLGVVVGLCWGFISVLLFSWRALVDNQCNYSPELPEGRNS